MTLDTARLKQALIDGMLYKIDSEIQRDKLPVFVNCEHAEKTMANIQAYKKKKTIKKRWIIALVAAALLALAGCIAVCRVELQHFIVDMIDGRNEIWQITPDDAPRYLEERMPAYLPDGYVLTYECESIVSIEKTWTNENGDTIHIWQNVIGTSMHGMDTDSGKYEILTINGREIYHHYWEDEEYLYLWQDKYMYTLSSSTPLQQEELEKIIASMP